MTAILFTVMLVFIGYSGYRALRESKNTRSLEDFYSFGPELSLPVVRRAFQATNISFTTSFVAIYLFGFAQGWFSFATPVCFCVGIIFYALLFLPHQIKLLASGHKYPELLARATSSPSVRVFVAAFVVFSLWMFTFAEVQGLHLFLRQLFHDSPRLVQIVPVLLVCAIAFYVSRNGYRATTSNDKFQIVLIFVGAWAILILVAAVVWNVGLVHVAESVSRLGNPFGTQRNAAGFLVETFFGFAFSQLLYYDNWQRLSFWVKAKLKADHIRDATRAETIKELKGLERDIRKAYLGGTIPMLLIFCAPIVLSFATMGNGTNVGDFATLSGFFVQSWNSFAVFGPAASFVGPPLVIFAFIFMLSALLSTAESYVIAISNCFVEDILHISIEKSGADVETRSRQLEAGRLFTAVIAVSLVPFLLIQPNFDTLFVYLFYSANGFVGPLVMIIFRRKFEVWTLLASVLVGFAYPAIPLVFPGAASFAPRPGIIPVVISLLLVGAFSKRDHKHELEGA